MRTDKDCSAIEINRLVDNWQGIFLPLGAFFPLFLFLIRHCSRFLKKKKIQLFIYLVRVESKCVVISSFSSSDLVCFFFVAMNIEEELPISITLSPPPTTELNDESEMPLASARPSTPDKCAVCLNNKQMDIIARIDSCAHTFCFACILEWSKVRAICPLCKQAFKLITRERYSGEIVEEVRVQNPQSATSRRFSNLNEVLNWLNQHRRAGPHHDHEPGRRPHDLFRQMVYMEWLNTVQALVHRPT